ncbi:MAG TPA: nitroreductase/quinone reductase family protein [Anaerolineaceae bacterium]|jgi:deazaflavin-dependent oxidoreductase (nitroreductase family)
MTISSNPQNEQLLQQGFKYFNKGMVMLWRLGLGKFINIWPDGSGRIMVIQNTGRHSGRTYYNPVNYCILNGDVYCTAGFGAKSDWYRNLRANPQVELWLPDSWYQGLAEDVTGCPGHTAIVRQVLIASGFAARMEGIDARVISDEELDRVTAEYRLVRIHLNQPRTGAGGPGDLAWVWPLATLLLLLAWPKRRGRR